MTQIRIYTTPICPYCVRAKLLLEKRELSYQEIDVAQDSELRQSLVALTGGRTSVPQIFFQDKYIGGCDDLYALEASGKLTQLITDLKLIENT